MFKHLKGEAHQAKQMSRSRFGVRAFLLLSLGLLHVAGDLSRFSLLSAISSATMASPAPKVFSSVNGLETFSSKFFIEWKDKSGLDHSIELTPEIYARIHGPYIRRNIFGAVLAYAPVLSSDPRTKNMYSSVVRYSLCGDSRILEEIGVDPVTLEGSPRVKLIPRAGTQFGADDFIVAPVCE